jgi:hypothetical protein
MAMIGEVIHQSEGAVYTTPIPRGGDGGRFRLDVLALEGTTPSLSCDVETRNINETSWTNAGSFTAITAESGGTPNEKDIASGLREIVRLKLTLTAGDLARVRILPPAWH